MAESFIDHPNTECDMVTDTYSKMMSEIPKRPMLINEYGEDLELLLREQRRQQEASEREKELNLYRSGSAPPTVEGSLNAVGGLFDASELLGFSKNGGEGFIAEEELRADPAYMNYYYSNVNLNPRLPPPLLSKEDWRFAQRLQGGNGGGGSVVGGIGDRMKVGNSIPGERSNLNTLFSVQPGIVGKEENRVESRNGGVTEWGGDGLIGLPGLGLGSQQKSFAELIQDDVNHTKILSRHPSRPASRNAFDNGIETSEAQFGFLHNDLASVDSFRSGGNKLAMSTVQNRGASASHSYASALGVSLSRSTTPDPQHAARAPSPRIPSAVVRYTCMDKRSATDQNSIIGVSPHLSESEDLVTALSGMNLSANNMRDEENHVHPLIHNDIDNHHNLLNVHGDQNYCKQNSYLNKSDSGHFNLHSHRQSAKGSYQNMGKSSAVGMDVNNYSLMSNEQHGLNNSANSCLKGPPSPTLNGRGSSSSHYQNVDSTFSPLPNYGLSGYAGSPTSPSFMGSPLGTGSLPPLYESAAVASAMGYTDSGAFGGGLALGPNMLAVAAEFQRNHSAGNALQVPLMDPMYLQYLRSNEYAAAQAATSNDDPRMDGECMSNPYMDLLQKAYLGALLSPQKSQFNVPYIGKSGGLNHGYYGNPSFGHGMSYPGSPLASPIYPNSPVGPGSPARHSERNLHFSSGTRNMTGFMGVWRSEAGGNLDEGFPSSLLDEFKSNKTKCFELSDIADHVVEFSADQYGSRFIQQKLETSTTEEKNMIFNEIMPQALALMTDVFGNYVIQKFFEHGTASQIRELADQLAGHVLTLSLQMYGCRVIQKAIEVVDMNQQTKMVRELDGHIMRCVRDQNGNHVIQKCIECVPEDAIQFIVSTFYSQVITLSTHPYGCRVIQRVLEHCHNPKTQQIMMDEILRSVCMLAQDQYGNYVVQHLLEHGKPHERTAIINKLTGQIVQMSQQKFASNVIEKCLSFGTLAERQSVVNEMLGSTNENDPLQEMMKDQFANYVVQKVLETCDDQQLELILNRIKVHLNALKKYTYGKHIVARVEKLVAAGERRISFLTPQPASTA